MSALRNPHHLSLHLANGTASFALALFVLAALAAVALAVGYRSRAAAAVSWLLLVSLHARNPMVLDAGDALLATLLFWAMFLPLGAAFSVDRALDTSGEPVPWRVFSAATAALFLQVALVYWFTAALKTGPEWRVEGNAVAYTLRTPYFVQPFGRLLLDHAPALLRPLTFASLLLEAAGPFFLLTPVFVGPVRTAAVAAFTLFHLGLAVSINLRLFAFTDIVGVLVFLPSWFWERIPPRLPALSALVGKLAALLERLGARLAAFAPSERRPLGISASLPAQLAAAFFILYAFLWNLGGISRVGIPAGARWVGYLLHLDQSWAMFAPAPRRDVGWHVLGATLQDGRRIDLLREGEPLTFEPPGPSKLLYPSKDWFLTLMFLGRPGPAQAGLCHSFFDTLCRRWNAGRPEGLGNRIRDLELDFVLERLNPDGTSEPRRVIRIWSEPCH